MRSTLLFVAVLLACTPVHAQATTPSGSAASVTWLDTFFSEPALQSPRKVSAERRTPAVQTFAHPARLLFLSLSAVPLPACSAPPLLHSPNAP